MQIRSEDRCRNQPPPETSFTPLRRSQNGKLTWGSESSCNHIPVPPWKPLLPWDLPPPSQIRSCHLQTANSRLISARNYWGSGDLAPSSRARSHRHRLDWIEPTRHRVEIATKSLLLNLKNHGYKPRQKKENDLSQSHGGDRRENGGSGVVVRREKREFEFGTIVHNKKNL